MAQMPRIPNGWLDGDDGQSPSSSAAKTMAGLENPVYAGVENGVLGGVDRGTLEVFRQMQARGEMPEEGRSIRPRQVAPLPINPADPDFQVPALPSNTGPDMFAPSKMTASPGLIDFLKSYEKGPDGGPALKPYPSPEKGRDTVGWGHKIQPDEDYSRGLTADQADQLFLKDLATHQKRVQDNVKVPLSQQQFDALVSLSYNLPKAFNADRSELLRDLNHGNYTGAADQFPRWDHGGPQGARMPGLTERRNFERDMFLNGVYTNHK